jgi:hypothetical protein
MKKLIPHITIVIILSLIVIIGFATNSGTIGGLIGVSGAFFLEPYILVAGVIAGFSKSYRKLLINGLLLSFVMVTIVYYNVSQWHDAIGVSHTLSQHIYYYSIRIMDVFILAHLVNIPVVLYFNKSTSKT